MWFFIKKKVFDTAFTLFKQGKTNTLRFYISLFFNKLTILKGAKIRTLVFPLKKMRIFIIVLQQTSNHPSKTYRLMKKFVLLPTLFAFIISNAQAQLSSFETENSITFDMVYSVGWEQPQHSVAENDAWLYYDNGIYKNNYCSCFNKAGNRYINFAS